MFSPSIQIFHLHLQLTRAVISLQSNARTSSKTSIVALLFEPNLRQSHSS